MLLALDVGNTNTVLGLYRLDSDKRQARPRRPLARHHPPPRKPPTSTASSSSIFSP